MRTRAAPVWRPTRVEGSLTSNFPISGAPEPVRDGTLADALAAGRVPLSRALEYAVQVGRELRAMHAAGLTHGKVSSAHIGLGKAGAQLLEPAADGGDPTSDVRGWGAVLYEIVIGTRPLISAAPEATQQTGGRSSIRPAARRLALRCLAHPGSPPSMQQALTEIRLLALLARQYRMHDDGTSPMSPFLVPPVPANPRATRLARLSALPPPAEADSGTKTSGLPDLTEADGAAGSGPCPRCDGAAISASQPRSRFERGLAWAGVPFCRCHRCYHRWIVIAGHRIGKRMPPNLARVKNRMPQKK
jgi:hypothetical protein